ncbi:hypothetical protein, partial [Salmonella enterica]|uniref:hypothetical protein n=1 Tax=Salmonella enterica TaxID=28901 RepID=UPI001EE908C4
ILLVCIMRLQKNNRIRSLKHDILIDTYMNIKGKINTGLSHHTQVKYALKQKEKCQVKITL